jgi:hypothetical protein
MNLNIILPLAYLKGAIFPILFLLGEYVIKWHELQNPASFE